MNANDGAPLDARERDARGRRCRELGDAQRASGDAAGAIATFESGLRADPADIGLHIGLGNALTACGDLPAAAASYRGALAVDPSLREARILLAYVLKLHGAHDDAAIILHALAADFPNDPVVAKEFGRLYFAQERLDAAEASFARVLQLAPADADAHHWLANIEHLRGNPARAAEHYRRTLALAPLFRVPATKTPADFSAIFLFAPGNANTPPDSLTRGAAYESAFLLLLPDADYDIDALRSGAQVVVNLISDVDRGAPILPAAQALADRLGLPVVNHPRAVMKTDRASVAATLADIPGCRVPRVRRSAGNVVAERAGDPGWTFPLLVRLAGTHGGEEFERADDTEAVARFTALHPDATFYFTEYVDYRSADGFFRKYRFFFIGDEILPYHLAIGATWKVHHATTAMADVAWMQREEQAFLDDPASAFGPQHFGALRAIRAAIGLDFCGIDCAIDRMGALVVFEVNATMLVHHDNERFAYKAPAVERITRAFNTLLAGLARQARDAARPI